jgi:hypothetical protein
MDYYIIIQRIMKEVKMKKTLIIVMVAFLLSPVFTYGGFFDDLFRGMGSITRDEPGESTIISGLKEALSIGTKNAVARVSQVDGYFGSEIIKILMPEKIQTVADVLRRVGFQQQVDDFIISMNRAAEKAAPEAVSYFVDAIQDMTFEDAKTILQGSQTAATDYFEEKTSEKIYDAFQPIISSSMNEVGVTRLYKDMMSSYELIPFVEKKSIDLDHYVTTKALDGLFYMVAEEEKKIRTDPAARVTDLLKTVFGK